MGLPRPDRLGRALTFAFVAALWVLAVPRASIASGCHVEDRPRFGLSSLPDGMPHESASLGSLPETSLGWAPRPCTGDSPASSARTITITQALPVSPVHPPTPVDVEPIHPIDHRLTSLASWSDLSRPPR